MDSHIGALAVSVAVQPVCPISEIVDAAIDAYVCWREECEFVREAYRGWSIAQSADRVLATTAYLAALDLEEVAASVYAAAMKRLGDECASGRLAEPRRVWAGASS